MGCKVYETYLGQYPQPSPAYEKVFRTIEQMDESMPVDKAERILKDSLVDAFPQDFTYGNNGELVHRGNPKSPNSPIERINNTVLAHFGRSLKSLSQSFLMTTSVSQGRVKGYTTILEINPGYYEGAVSAARQRVIPTKNEQAIVQQVKQVRAGQQIAMFEQEPTTKSKTLPSDAPFTELPNFEQQLQHLKDTFASVGITVQVKFDTEMESKGEVNRIADNIAEITLNPNKMTADTHIHEFSHILIDLLGMNNPLVQSAMKIARESSLFEEVKLAYGDDFKDDESIAKETLVTLLGREGAKRIAKPSGRLQTAINYIIRRIKQVFGISDSAIDQLVTKLLSKRLAIEEIQGELAEETQKSRQLDRRVTEFTEFLEVTSETLQQQLDKLEANPFKSDEEVIEIKAQLEKFKQLRKDAAKGIENSKFVTFDRIEAFASFVNYVGRVVAKNQLIVAKVNKAIDSDLKKLTEEEKHALNNELFNLGNSVRDLMGGTTADKSILSRLKQMVIDRQDRLAVSGKSNKALTALEEKLRFSIDKLERQQKFYIDEAVTVQADLLLDYMTDGINTEVLDLIENIKTNQRTFNLKRDGKYKELKKKLKDKKITDAEFKKAIIDLNVEQLKNKIVGRETLINELREAQIDKSSYSVYMDPIMYSSQISMQLFGSMVKSKLYQASDDVREIVDELAPFYEAMAAVKGTGINPVDFNSDILETHTYYVLDPETGRRKPMDILTLVQQYDVTKFNSELYAMKRKLAEKYEKPKNVERDEYLKWKRSAKGLAYERDVAQWYKTNTVLTEQGKKEFDKIGKKIEEVKALVKKHGVAGSQPEVDKHAIAEARLIDLRSQANAMYDKKNDQFKGTVVRPNSKYLNPKYEAIQEGNPAVKAYYDKLLEIYTKMQKTIGPNNQIKNDWDTISYAVPSMEAEGFERLQQSNYNVFSSTKDYLQRGFTFLETDDAYGATINANKEQRNKIVPTYYTTPTDAKYVSHDIGSTIIAFAGMASMFKRKAEITGSVIIMRDIIERREVLDVTANNIPFASHAANKLGISRQSRRIDEQSNNFKHLTEFIDRIFFGEEEIKQELDIFGKTLSVNKLSNKLVTFTALNALALNALQATNQYLIDNVRIIEESIAGQYFNKANAFWGKATYTKAIASGETLTDAGKFRKTSKLARFIDDFDLLLNSLEDYKDKRAGNRLVKAIDRNSLFFLQHMAEHETAVTRGLALADSYRGKLKDKAGNVILNEEGKPANLYEVYTQDENGKWRIDPKVANFKKINFINLISGVYKKTNQIKSKFDDPMANRRWFGKMALLFRRYFQPAIRKRFGYGDQLHLDLETDTITEGSYNSFGRYIKEVVQGGFKFGSVYKMMTPMEKANVKRTAMELSMWVVTLTIGNLLVAAMKDDEDDEEYLKAFFAYQALRINAELGQFIPVIGIPDMYKFIVSPSATLRPVVDAAKLLKQLFVYELPYRTLGVEGFEDELFYQKKSGDHLKGDSKTLVLLEKLAPAIKGYEQSTTPEEALKFFTGNPIR
jgi:hypothetical protein